MRGPLGALRRGRGVGRRRMGAPPLSPPLLRVVHGPGPRRVAGLVAGRSRRVGSKSCTPWRLWPCLLLLRVRADGRRIAGHLIESVRMHGGLRRTGSLRTRYLGSERAREADDSGTAAAWAARGEELQDWLRVDLAAADVVLRTRRRELLRAGSEMLVDFRAWSRAAGFGCPPAAPLSRAPSSVSSLAGSGCEVLGRSHPWGLLV